MIPTQPMAWGGHTWRCPDLTTPASSSRSTLRSAPTTPPPPVWFHDIFHADGTPYNPEETDLIKRLTQVKTNAKQGSDRCSGMPAGEVESPLKSSAMQSYI